MENCLETRFKGQVINDALPKLGVLRIAISCGSGIGNEYSIFREIKVKTNSNSLVTVGRGHNVYDNQGVSLGSSINLTANLRSIFYLLEEGEYYIDISNKYALTELKINGHCIFNLDNLQFSTSLNSLEFYANSEVSLTGNLEKLPSTLTKLSIQNDSTTIPDVVGTTDDLSRLSNLSTLSFTQCPNLTGEFYKLAGLSLTPLINYTGISGSIEDYVKSKVAAGVTTGEMIFSRLHTNSITFKGVALVVKVSTVLSWEPSAAYGKTKITYDEDVTEIDNE